MRYLGYHRERGAAGTSPTLPPLARLRRRGCSMVASGVEILWMMDHRASSRPFSMREISAWGMPVRFASSDSVDPPLGALPDPLAALRRQSPTDQSSTDSPHREIRRASSLRPPGSDRYRAHGSGSNAFNC